MSFFWIFSTPSACPLQQLFPSSLNYWEPPCLFTPLDFGLVGFSFACGLGVKLGCPERPVVSLMGDGGFGMTLSELSTAVQYGINTVTLVMNNQCWGAEKAYQRDFFGERYIGADIPGPPFDKVAELYGAAGFRVERLAEVGDLRRPRVIVTVTHGHDRQRLFARHDGAMAGPGMVGMAVGDQRPVDGADRIDEEIARRTIKPARLGPQKLLGSDAA